VDNASRADEPGSKITHAVGVGAISSTRYGEDGASNACVPKAFANDALSSNPGHLFWPPAQAEAGGSRPAFCLPPSPLPRPTIAVVAASEGVVSAYDRHRPPALDRELKKGAAELLLLSVLEARPRHGYELGKLIETLSGGRLVFHLDSLYPLLYRLEERGWIKGTWVEKAGERGRRFYRLTPAGQRVLLRQRETWDDFVEAVRLVTRGEHA
jgi:PadR family transcriptional regulator, regulatory protein PadR